MDIEICSNTEWWRVYGLDYDGIDEEWEEEAANDFQRMLAVALEKAGYTVTSSRRQRALCHGWHGAVFTRKSGGIGTFDDVTQAAWEAVWEVRDEVETRWAAEWRKLHPATKATAEE